MDTGETLGRGRNQTHLEDKSREEVGNKHRDFKTREETLTDPKRHMTPAEPDTCIFMF